jgi:hypothetical protein
MSAITVKPSDGGKLITRAATADAGASNYLVKRNWRRDLTDEIRREGHDYFIPLSSESDAQSQPFPVDDSFPADEREINLIYVVRRPNGESAVVVGTKTTLFRFNVDLSGYVEGEYVEDIYSPDPAGVPYFEEPSRWQIIGEGFSENGRRWEVSSIDGETVFNNSVDLPVSYRVEWRFVKPLYELREQGVVSVGTIAEFNGILLCGDVTELTETDLDTYLGLEDSGVITVTQTGFTRSGAITATTSTTLGVTTMTASAPIFTSDDAARFVLFSDGSQAEIDVFVNSEEVRLASNLAITTDRSFIIDEAYNFYPTDVDGFSLIASAPLFTADMVGLDVTFPDGSTRRITKYISTTHVKTDTTFPANGGVAGIIKWDNPDAYIAKDAFPASVTMNQRQYKIIWSELNKPSSFAYRGLVAARNSSRTLEIARTMKSIQQFDEVIIEGAGESGGVLATIGGISSVKISSVGPGFITLNTTPITSTDAGYISKRSAIDSTAGYDDLQDDGSGILKMMPLQNRLVIYKDTTIFLAAYTGDNVKPFVFERVGIPHDRTLHYRNTLVCINGLAHVFAGRREFYQFDLTTRIPTQVPSADLVENLFFDYANIEDTESIFAADNTNTQEIWIVIPANTADPVLAYDYKYQTFSTVDFAPSAAATVKDAVFPLVRETGNQFLIGTSTGVLLMYGLTTEPRSSWDNERQITYRRNDRPYSADKDDYDSTLTSSLIHFGDPFNEKHISNYVLQFSSVPEIALPDDPQSPDITVTFNTSKNQKGTLNYLGKVNILDSNKHGLVPMHSTFHYFQDNVVASGSNNPMRVHMRTFDVRMLGSKSFSKRPT